MFEVRVFFWDVLTGMSDRIIRRTLAYLVLVGPSSGFKYQRKMMGSWREFRGEKKKYIGFSMRRGKP